MGVPFLICAVLITLASRSSADVLEENALDGCGVSHRTLHDTANGWHHTPCRSENNGACFVQAHEERYRALVKACDEAHTNQSTLVRQYRADLPQYSSDVRIAVSQLNATLQTQHDRLESLVQDHHEVLLNTTDYAVRLVRDIVLASLEANRTDQALQHYAGPARAELKQLVLDSYQGSPGSRKVALLLQFVRALPDAQERTVAYRQLEELLQTNQQDERYPGILFAEDGAKYGEEYRPNPAVTRSGRWSAGSASCSTVSSANRFSSRATIRGLRAHRPELLRLVTERWSAEALPRLVEYPNALPRTEQRIRAFRVLLAALQKQQPQLQLNDQHLMQLAGELSKLERSLAGSEGTELTELRPLFPQLTYDRSFLTYTELFAQYKPVV
uniref:Secretion protein gp65 n=1 Tax=Anopheles albimanus TaxID=7167 RepID=Q86CT5_ANOAL|nr:secretion protein gp65 [Anopheles albimanus]